LCSSTIVSLVFKKFSAPLFAKGTITPSVRWPILLYHTNCQGSPHQPNTASHLWSHNKC
jgi:hypothetical protein